MRCKTAYPMKDYRARARVDSAPVDVLVWSKVHGWVLNGTIEVYANVPQAEEKPHIIQVAVLAGYGALNCNLCKAFHGASGKDHATAAKSKGCLWLMPSFVGILHMCAP